MIVLASLCLLIGIFPSTIVSFMRPALASISVAPPTASIDGMMNSLRGIQLCSFAFLALILMLAVARKFFIGEKNIKVSETWGCGYDKPDARMQYTSVSFAEPFVSLIGPLTRPNIAGKVPAQHFPEATDFKVDVGDPILDRAVVPAYAWIGKLFGKFSIIQHGNTHLYVLYIVLALLAALVWGLGL
ncbi:MAG: hypothetical protein WC820_03450, partial [Spirochaetales bacterium]|jgi:hypothetical protein